MMGPIIDSKVKFEERFLSLNKVTFSIFSLTLYLGTNFIMQYIEK